MRALACLALLAGPPDATLPQPAAARITSEQAEALVREMSATVEQLRRLRFQTPVAVEVIDGAEARRDFAAGIDDADRERARITRDAWAHLGLVPASADLVKAELDLAESEVLGYYETGSKKFRVLSHVDPRELPSVMAHELTHALEDQHYDLRKFERAALNEDHAVALRAVVEGSAMVTTLAVMQRQGGIARAKEEAARVSQERARTVRSAPSFVQMRLLMPYTLGFSFLLRGKPWEWLFDGVRIEDVDSAYAQPPHATREVLHPERYWGVAREKAHAVPLPDLSKQLGAGWSLALTGSVGELGLTMLTGSALDMQSFRIMLPTHWITAGATGNRGDLYQHYVRGEEKVTVFLTRWESPLDADEFQRDLRLPRAVRKTFFRMGVNVVVLLGDFGDRGPAIATEAVRGLRYWADE